MKLAVISVVSSRSRIADRLACPGAGDRTTSEGETTNMTRTARCLCGNFSVIVAAEPVMVNVCHCLDCQRRSGVPWSSAAYFPKEAVRLHGPNKIYARTSEAGNSYQPSLLPNLWGHCLLDPRDGLHPVWDSGWGVQRSRIPRPDAIGLGKATLRVVARHGKHGALGHAAAASLKLLPAPLSFAANSA